MRMLLSFKTLFSCRASLKIFEMRFGVKALEAKEVDSHVHLDKFSRKSVCIAQFVYKRQPVLFG